MARYKFWDKQSPIYPPAGKRKEKEQILEEYGWAEYVPAIIENTEYPGGVFMRFDIVKDMYQRSGMPQLDDDATDEEWLECIGEWEVFQEMVGSSEQPDATTELAEAVGRLAACEEFKIMLDM